MEVQKSEFKNDGDFTDHGETFVYLVNSHLWTRNIPDKMVLMVNRGYVYDCWNSNKDSANYPTRSVNFYLQI